MHSIDINKKLEFSPKENGLLDALGLVHHRAIDLLLNLPYRWSAKKYAKTFNDLKEGEIVILEIKILKIIEQRRVLIIPVEFAGSKDTLELIFFQFNLNYMKSIYPVQKKIFISGKLVKNVLKKKKYNVYGEKSNALFQIAHPEILKNFDVDAFEKGLVYSDPIYHCAKNISNDVVTSFISMAFRKIQMEMNSNGQNIEFPEWLNEKILQKFGWVNFFEALKILHQYGPNYKIYDNKLLLKAKQRIMFDEFFIKSLGNKILKHNMQAECGRKIKGDFSLRKKVLDSLGFELTQNQKKILEEDIYADQFEELKMLRMIQGDVGSGKTVVAMLSMLNSVESGFQAILMAPTEILAKQHYEHFLEIFEKASILANEEEDDPEKVSVIFLSSSVKKKSKILLQIENPDSKRQIIIGTHALFQEKVKFNKIGLIVIDEQHRFGVKARQDLGEKDNLSDVLLMSATPIPRTLAMTEFGYLDHSLLTEKPANRKKIITSVVNSEYLDEIFLKIKDVIKKDERVYWICPLIEESLKLDLVAIEKRASIIYSIFGLEKVGVIHGKMKEKEINEIMEQFQSGEKKILIATTVVEVGLNVPNATLIVIEEAQRFGLAQLHQLRGRVGRSDLESFCTLVYSRNQISEIGLSRLKSLAKSENGFEIAEIDLKLRGSGEFSGLKQSGFGNYITGSPAENEKIFEKANQFSGIIFEKYKNNTKEMLNKFQFVIDIFNVYQKNI